MEVTITASRIAAGPIKPSVCAASRTRRYLHDEADYADDTVEFFNSCSFKLTAPRNRTSSRSARV